MPVRIAALIMFGFVAVAAAQESPYLYGIHDHSPSPDGILSRAEAAGRTMYVTATVAIGANPADFGGEDFTLISNRGHTVICRLNFGYCEVGTIPLPELYADFAQRCANFVAASSGCHIWVIGNETNLATEWPPRNGHKEYVSPQSYADCFRQCYDAIKAVRPNDKVVSQALAPFGGPYGPGTTCGYPHDGVPLNWTQYCNQMLTAIAASGGIDGIALHINSRGYRYEDIHSTQQVSANGQSLYFSFYVYKDWVNYGIPASLYHLPLYATESNGIYYWKGGFPGHEGVHYEPGWMQEVHAEIDRYNQSAIQNGKPVYRCINMYRWCSWCDGWNIDGDNPYRDQMFADWDAAFAADYRWPTEPGEEGPLIAGSPVGDNLALNAAAVTTSSEYGPAWGGENAVDGVVSDSSKWTSSASAPPHWLAVDLGGEHVLDGYVIRHAGDAGESTFFNLAAYDLQVGDSLSGPWTTLESIVTGGANVIERRYRTPTAERFVRLYITDPGGDDIVRLPEFEIVGYTPAPQPIVAPGDELLTSGDFSTGLDDWTEWYERNADLTITANAGLLISGSDFNAGVYQTFYTGGADQRLTVAGQWSTDPAVAQSQWGEVIVINSLRLPVIGVDENGQADHVLAFKNDTWQSPGGWSGAMSATSPLGGPATFRTTGDTVTLLVKSGNVGGALTGLRVDQVSVKVAPADGDLDADDTVDAADALVLLGALTGDGVEPPSDALPTPSRLLGAFDFDADRDLDLVDVAVFSTHLP